LEPCCLYLQKVANVPVVHGSGGVGVVTSFASSWLDDG